MIPPWKSKIMPIISVYLKGILMGIADIIPGISGGTIAFITGIYYKLIQSIRSITLKKNLLLLIHGDYKKFLEAINFSFLITLLSGIITTILLFSKLILFLLEHYPIFIWSLFLGVIGGSIIIILQKINRWSWIKVVILLLTIMLTYYLVALQNYSIDITSKWYFLLGGTISIIAMILPGISGSFILILIGLYKPLLESIENVQSMASHSWEVILSSLQSILLFLTGCIIGLLSFIRLLNYLLKYHYSLIMTILLGFMIGASAKLWPWKEKTESKKYQPIYLCRSI